jgi:hypothetical protein
MLTPFEVQELAQRKAEYDTLVEKYARFFAYWAGL